MVSKILDATAFYAGIPFVSNDSFMTTSIVYEEIQHIKAKQGALEMLQQTNRLQIRDPSEKNIDIVKDASIKTGDNATISKQDMSIIALALENDCELITDDFAVTNVAKQLKIKTTPLDGSSDLKPKTKTSFVLRQEAAAAAAAEAAKASAPKKTPTTK